MLWQILLLPTHSIYKQIVITRYMDYHNGHVTHDNQAASGPIVLFYHAADQLGIQDTIRRAIVTGIYTTKNSWKSYISNRINDRECNILIAACHMYSSLEHFKNSVETVKMWPWWEHSMKNPDNTKQCRLLLKLTTGVSVLNFPPGSQEFQSHPICELCVHRQQSDPVHVLFVCTSLEDTRVMLWDHVRQHCPTALWEELSRMVPPDKFSFISSGFRCKYTREWSGLYSAILRFITDMMSSWDAICQHNL